MAQVRASRWAPLSPWSGIQGKPAFLDGPDGNITIDSVRDLRAALNGKVDKGSLSRLAYTGQWADILGKPTFGSAAFADVDNFIMAATARTLQVGEVPYVAAQQSYAVVFTRTMSAVPKVRLQTFIIDATSGEMFFAVVQKDSVSTAGFTFWLSGAPTGVTGSCQYEAVVESQPA